MYNQPYRSHVTTDHVGTTQPATLAAFPSTPRVTPSTGVSPYMGLFRPYVYNGSRPSTGVRGEK
jgi:hypothetical protein